MLLIFCMFDFLLYIYREKLNNYKWRSRRQWFIGRALASHTKGPKLESYDEQAGSVFGIFPHKRNNWLSFQEADIEHDLYMLKACFAINVK